LMLQQDTQSWDTPLHTACRHHFLVVLRWLLPRADADVLLAATKDGWLPLHTACRCGAEEEAAAYLEEVERWGLLEEEGPRKVILSDLSPFNRYYRDHGAVEVLHRALERVRSGLGHLPAFPVAGAHLFGCHAATPASMLAPGGAWHGGVHGMLPSAWGGGSSSPCCSVLRSRTHLRRPHRRTAHG
ncbi:hypothetical protein Agub_g7753, partial [Astrephomene gubernaculifera]